MDADMMLHARRNRKLGRSMWDPRENRPNLPNVHNCTGTGCYGCRLK